MQKKISDFYNKNPFNFDIKIIEDIKNSKKSSIPIDIKKLIDKYTVRSIIDIGCGSGYFVNLIKYHYPEIKVDGLDFSKVQLNNAKKISRGLNQKINYINKDFLTAKLNEKYDFVFCNGVIHHNKLYKKFFNKILKLRFNFGVLGLYSASRKTFFEFFKNEHKLFYDYFDSKDLAKTWYNDQFNNLYEKTFTLIELQKLFKQKDFKEITINFYNKTKINLKSVISKKKLKLLEKNKSERVLKNLKRKILDVGYLYITFKK